MNYGAVKSVRWVASKSRALSALSRNLHSTYMHAEHASSNQRNTDEVGKAQSIKRAIGSVRFVKYLYLMQDFLAIVVATSRLFQQNVLLIVEVPNHIDQLVMQLKHMKTVPGKHMLEFYEKMHADGTFGTTRFKLNMAPTGKVPIAEEYSTDPDVVQLIDATLDYIKKRFSSSMKAPFSHFDAFNFHVWPYNLDELVIHGDDDITGLVTHFKDLLSEEEVARIANEWPALKAHVVKLRTSSMLDVYRGLVKDPPSHLKNILVLVELMLTVSPSTAQCERGFSSMNKIKTSQRNSLTQTTLQDLMTICIDGPSLEEFDSTDSINYWLTAGPGTRHLDGHQVKHPDTALASETLIAAAQPTVPL